MCPVRIPVVSVVCTVLVFFIAGTDELAAQFRGVALSPDRVFGFLDQNRNDMLDPEELDRIPPAMREALGRMRIDLRRPVSKEAFFKVAGRLTEELQHQREERFRSSDRKRLDSRSRVPDIQSNRISRPALSASRATIQPPRPRVTVDLPESYRDRDKNRDGQIGLYEWDRTAFAEFFRLDRNGDGFLTPRELTPIVSASATSSKTTSKTSSSSRALSVRPTSASTSRTRSLSSGTTTSTSLSSGTTTRESKMAAFVFRSLDKNHDGSVSADEWEQSRRTRQDFEKAKVKLPVPIHFEQFAEMYVRVTRSVRR